MTIEDETKKKMEGALQKFVEELKVFRTGRANAQMVEGVTVELYGTRIRIRDIASITVPDSRTIQITPHNPPDAEGIAKGLEASELGFRAQVRDGRVLVAVPEMSGSQRTLMVKLCHEKREKCRIAIRSARQDGLQSLKRKKTAKEIPEDQERRGQKKIQEYTDQYCQQADDLSAAKEKEIMTV